MTSSKRSLNMFRGDGYDKGKPMAAQIAWMLTSSLVFRHWWCPNAVRIAILRTFGAEIGTGVLIRHNVRIHWPWKLKIGSHSWIGEQAWLLNLETITIGDNVCISQAAILCTGSHDRHSPTFEFDNASIEIKEGAWVAIRATVLRGVTVGERSIIGATALASCDVPSDTIVYAPRPLSKNAR